MNINYKVSYAFVGLPDSAIADFTDTAINGMTGNAGLPNPPVALTLVDTQKADYLVKLAATAQGGTLATAEKNAAREVLAGSLRKLAAYVQSLAGNDLTLLLSSGFQPVSTNRAQTPLPKPVVLRIENGATGQLVVRVQTMSNARAFETQFKNGTGGWQRAASPPVPGALRWMTLPPAAPTRCSCAPSAAAPAIATGAIRSATWWYK